MLNTKDLKLIREVVSEVVSEVVNSELSEFAIMVQNGFREIMETKADKADVATKIDIERLETELGAKIDRLDNKFEGRIEKAEDNIRVIKTKLKIA
jgi:hypothetical protein